MKIRIIQISKTKDQYLKSGINEFIKRLGPFCDPEIITLKEVKPTKTFEKERCVEAEGKEVLKLLGGTNDFVMCLDENGKTFNSIEFAGFVKKFKDRGKQITFVIGGPFGISEEVKACSDLVFSLSKMTFTHQMVRLFLLEQIYRAFTIIQGKNYHN